MLDMFFVIKDSAYCNPNETVSYNSWVLEPKIKQAVPPNQLAPQQLMPALEKLIDDKSHELYNLAC